ncbi:MAG TPA: hypothetical protein VJR89_30760, partial [Polyangiales bacterium]|nr:hypothetical protein [Polyangiales bacterium]
MGDFTRHADINGGDTMATEHTYAEPRRENVTVGPPATLQKRAVQAVGVGSGVESLAGIGAVTLAILGLAGVLPFVFAAIATIVVGGGLLLEGIAIAGSYAAQARESADYDVRDESIVGGGMTVQTLGGAAGITLGIIALAAGGAWTLLSVAAIVFGGTLL